MSEQSTHHRTNLIINILTVAIPLVVALLLGIRTKIALGDWTKLLPHVIGGINSLTAILLIVGFVAQRSKNIKLHRFAMTTAFALGACFLVCYVTYHLSNPSTHFLGEGVARIFYYFVLLSHIALSLLVLPLVLRSFIYAWTSQFERHRAVAKYAFPIWLYVSVTGVIAYVMISPYYGR